MSTSLSCLCCHLLFESSDLHREHYRSELHRFNLKRKVAGLAPVTGEVFEAKQKSINLKNKRETKYF